MNEVPRRCSGAAGQRRSSPGPPRWCARAADGGVGDVRPRSCARSSNIAEPSRRELLRISALGLYRAFINGERVGNDLLTPGWTSLRQAPLVPDLRGRRLLRPAHNVIDIWLADGWYRSQMMWQKQPDLQHLGERDRRDRRAAGRAGRRCADRADDRRQSGQAASCRSEVRHLFRRDLRCAARGARGRDKRQPRRSPSTLIVLVPHEIEPVRELKPLLPVAYLEGRREVARSTTSARTSAAIVAFTVEGEAGAKVIIEHAEILDRDNSFDNRNYAHRRSAHRVHAQGRRQGELSPFFHLPGLPLCPRDDRGQG